MHGVVCEMCIAGLVLRAVSCSSDGSQHMPPIQKRPARKDRKRPGRPPSHSGKRISNAAVLQTRLIAAQTEATKWADIARRAQAESAELRRSLAAHVESDAEHQRTIVALREEAAALRKDFATLIAEVSARASAVGPVGVQSVGCGESLDGEPLDQRDLHPPLSWLTGSIAQR